MELINIPQIKKPEFIKINGTRINVEKINHYTVCIGNEEYKLIINFEVDEIFFKTKDKHELERWLAALGEEK